MISNFKEIQITSIIISQKVKYKSTVDNLHNISNHKVFLIRHLTKQFTTIFKATFITNSFFINLISMSDFLIPPYNIIKLFLVIVKFNLLSIEARSTNNKLEFFIREHKNNIRIINIMVASEILSRNRKIF